MKRVIIILSAVGVVGIATLGLAAVVNATNPTVTGVTRCRDSVNAPWTVQWTVFSGESNKANQWDIEIPAGVYSGGRQPVPSIKGRTVSYPVSQTSATETVRAVYWVDGVFAKKSTRSATVERPPVCQQPTTTTEAPPSSTTIATTSVPPVTVDTTSPPLAPTTTAPEITSTSSPTTSSTSTPVPSSTPPSTPPTVPVDSTPTTTPSVPPQIGPPPTVPDSSIGTPKLHPDDTTTPPPVDSGVPFTPGRPTPQLPATGPGPSNWTIATIATSAVVLGGILLLVRRRHDWDRIRSADAT